MMQNTIKEGYGRNNIRAQEIFELRSGHQVETDAENRFCQLDEAILGSISHFVRHAESAEDMPVEIENQGVSCFFFWWDTFYS